MALRRAVISCVSGICCASLLAVAIPSADALAQQAGSGGSQIQGSVPQAPPPLHDTAALTTAIEAYLRAKSGSGGPTGQQVGLSGHDAEAMKLLEKRFGASLNSIDAVEIANLIKDDRALNQALYDEIYAIALVKGAGMGSHLNSTVEIDSSASENWGILILSLLPGLGS